MLTGSKQVLSLIRTPLSEVEKAIHLQSKEFDPAIQEAITYACRATGKQLRSALALLTAGATGKIHRQHIDLGIIIELIHLATLIHDDIMDGADTRRDQPTINARWGNTVSVLLGDSLFAHALSLTTQFNNTEISRKIANAAKDVCTGEILQNQRRFDLELTLKEYLRMIELKTASLFSTSAELGAMLNKVDPATIVAMRKYGSTIGTAYQIYDDCLDIAGQEATAGKTLGTDILKGKLTLPVLFLRNELTSEDRNQLDQSLLQKTCSLQMLRDQVFAHGAFAQAVAYSEELLNDANAQLETLSPSPYKEALKTIGTQLLRMIKDLGTL